MRRASSLYFTSLLLATMLCGSSLLAQKVDTVIVDGQKIIYILDESGSKRCTFTDHVDSLFAEARYEDLIQYCNWKIEHSRDSWRARQVMMSAFYFLGNHVASDELYAELVNAEGLPRTPYEMINSNMVPIVKYFEIPENKNKIIAHILKTYDREALTKPVEGAQLLNFYLECDWARRDNKDMVSLNANADKDMANLQDQLYAYFRSGNSLFSVLEIGSVYYYQFLLLKQEQDLERRAFYFSLIQEAVKQGKCELEREVSYYIQTQSIKEGPAFWQNYESRRAEIISQYGIKDLSFTPY